MSWLLGKFFLTDRGARVLGPLPGELPLAGGDLPVHLGLIAQPGLALSLLSLLAAHRPLALALSRWVANPFTLIDDELALIGEALSLYERLAETLDRTAELAEQHAERCGRDGNQAAAAMELKHTEQARNAAQRARRLAANH